MPKKFRRRYFTNVTGPLKEVQKLAEVPLGCGVLGGIGGLGVGLWGYGGCEVFGGGGAPWGVGYWWVLVEKHHAGAI